VFKGHENVIDPHLKESPTGLSLRPETDDSNKVIGTVWVRVAEERGRGRKVKLNPLDGTSLKTEEEKKGISTETSRMLGN